MAGRPYGCEYEDEEADRAKESLEAAMDANAKCYQDCRDKGGGRRRCRAACRPHADKVAEVSSRLIRKLKALQDCIERQRVSVEEIQRKIGVRRSGRARRR